LPQDKLPMATIVRKAKVPVRLIETPKMFAECLPH
jgi:hypothetical protein